MASRRYGEGSIRFDAKRGVYVGQLEGGIDEHGKRIRRRVYAKLRADVVAKMDEERARLAAGVPATDREMTVARYMDQWLAGLAASGSVQSTTVTNYRNLSNLYIVPNLGTRPLAKLTPLEVEKMLTKLAKDGKSPNTRRLARATLRRALGDAMRQGLVMRNVAQTARGPKIDQAYTGRAMTASEAHALLDAARDDVLEPYVVLGLFLGLRGGEVLGLRWRDVDLDAKTLRVGATLARVETGEMRTRGDKEVRASKLVTKAPKTAGSRRQLPIPAPVLVSLQAQERRQAAWRLAAGEMWKGEKKRADWHVVTTDIGTPIDPANARHRFQALTERAGIGRWRPHEMRHSTVSLLLEYGVDLHRISDIAGHSSIKLTSDTYGHLGVNALSDALDLLADRITTANKAKTR